MGVEKVARNKTFSNNRAGTPLSLKRNFSWTFSGNVIYALCQWGMLTSLAKLGTPELVGQFALALAITTPVIAFANLQLRGVQATDAKGQFQFADYLALRSLTSVAALLAIVGVTLWASYDAKLSLTILIVAVGKSFDAGSDIIYGLFQHRQQMNRVATGMICNGLGSLVLFSAGMVWAGSLVVAVLGATVSSLATLMLVNIPAVLRLLRQAHVGDLPRSGTLTLIKPRWSFETIMGLSRLAFPLGIVMLLVSLNASIPQFFIQRFLGQSELGIFAALAYLIIAGSTIVSALGQSASPKLAQYYAAGMTQQFVYLLSRLVFMGFGAGIAGVVLSFLAGEAILSRLYSEQYADYTRVLIILALSAGMTYAASFLGNGITAARVFRAQVPLFSLVAIIAAASCSMLIPRYGLNGAAVAVLTASIAQVLGSLWVISRAINNLGVRNA